jgi:glyoxylase-like metal-dependent hydrolase (beta-lactamase superfamily II)
MADSLMIKTFTLGSYQTNCFVVYPQHSDAGEGEQPCWIVDAGVRPQPMLDFIREHSLKPNTLILTHAHVDHIAGVAEIRQAFPELPIWIHESERDFPGDASLNLSIYIDTPTVAPDPSDTLVHGQTLQLGNLSFEVRHTPGHSPGGITLYCAEQGVAIVGDTLFAGSIGRFDFPTSDGQALIQSIHRELLSLPDDTTIHPGHGPTSTIGQERRSNPYLRETGLVS